MNNEKRKQNVSKPLEKPKFKGFFLKRLPKFGSNRVPRWLTYGAE